MTLPAFATITDLEARMGPLDDDIRTRARLADASALIHFESRNLWVDSETGELVADSPPICVTICCNVVERSLRNPLGVVQDSVSLGDYSESNRYGDSSSDVYLKKSEVAKIRAAAGLSSGVWTMSTTRDDTSTGSDTVYVDVVGGEATPWRDVNDPSPPT